MIFALKFSDTTLYVSELRSQNFPICRYPYIEAVSGKIKFSENLELPTLKDRLLLRYKLSKKILWKFCGFFFFIVAGAVVLEKLAQDQRLILVAEKTGELRT